MLKKIVTLLLLVFNLHADIYSFYEDALNTLKYDESYNLYKTSNETSQNGVIYSKYANFNFRVDYAHTRAKYLPYSPGTFSTADIYLTDTIDIFGKNNYKIESLRLDQKSTKAQLNIKKEQLFIALVNLINLYNSTSKALKLHQKFLKEQELIYKKLALLSENGDIIKISLLRFKNTLTILKTTIASQNQLLLKMKMQLPLFSKYDFIAQNPQATLNSLKAQKQIAQADGMNNTYFPIFTTTVGHQNINDPTSSGDNYYILAGLNIPLNTGNFKKAEALKTASLSTKTQESAYKIKREKNYIEYKSSFDNASSQLDILEKALSDYDESESTIKTAFIKQYIDFNTYLQVLKQSLDVKKQIIAMDAQKKLNATLINGIASGKIYTLKK